MANLLDKASILLTPSDYNSGSILAIKPINGDGDSTFSRNSVATRTNEQGLINSVTTNLSRIDHTSGCGIWLLEPQSTNLITQSELFSNSSWSKYNTSLSSGFLSPNGTNNAFKIIESTATNLHIFRYQIAFQANQTHTLSVFLKQNGRSKFALAAGGVSLGLPSFQYRSGEFDLSNGTIDREPTGGSATITSFGNGWYRCTASFTPLVNGTGKFDIYLHDNNGNSNYTGNGVNGIYIYGAQLEKEVSYPTSYIPTSGIISTRVREVVTDSGNASLINSEEGSLYLDIASLANDGTLRSIGLSDGTINNVAYIGFNSTDNQIIAIYKVAGVVTASLSYTVTDVTSFNKICFTFSVNNFYLEINGSTVDSSTSGSVAASSTFTKLNFDIGDSTQKMFCKLNCVAVFKEVLTSQQRASLTTI